MTYPYPVRAKTLTAAEVQEFLRRPALVARRLQEFTDLSFLTDYLLKGSADATGTGAVLVEREGSLFVDGEPEVVAPDGEYPYVGAADVGADQIPVAKRGFRHVLTDEKIKRSPNDELRKFFVRASNTMIRNFDSFGRAVIASLATDTMAGGAWTDGKRIVKDVLGAVANREELERGVAATAVVLKPTQYAVVAGELIGANLMPREAGNPLLTGARSFSYMGLTWVKSLYSPWSNPTVVDVENLGGVATEDIGSPDFSRSGAAGDRTGIEVKTKRNDRDGWDITIRRVATPYVTGTKAAVQITGTGL